MEAKLAIAIGGIIIAGAIPALMGSIWGAVLTVGLAFIAMSVFIVLDPAAGAVAWLASLTPIIFVARTAANSTRKDTERRHREVVAAIRANSPVTDAQTANRSLTSPARSAPSDPNSLDFDPDRVAAVLDAISTKKA